MTRRSARLLPHALLAALCAGALLRGWAYLQVRGAFLYPGDQEEGYYEQGVTLLSRGVFSLGLSDNSPRLWRGPVFPAFAALTEVPFRVPSPGHLRLAQQLLSILGIAFAFWLGSRAAGAAAGLLGAALFALDPGQALTANSLNIHAFYGLALLALAGAAALWAEKPDRRRGLLFGAAFGATMLTRSAHFLALPLVLAIGLPRGDGRRAAARRAAWPLLGLALALAPWTVRNAVQFRRFQPLDSYSGAVNLYAASIGDFGSYEIEDAVRIAEPESPGLTRLYTADRDAVFPILLRLAMRHIRERPLRYAWTTVLRWRDLYGAWWPALLLAAFGVWRRRRGRPALAAAAVGASLAAYGLIGVQEGYSGAARPLLAVLAGWGLAALLETARRAPAAEIPGPEPAPARAGALLFAALFAATFAVAEAAVVREPFIARPAAPGRAVRLPPMNGERVIDLMKMFTRTSPRSEGALQLAFLLEGAGRRAEACAAFERAWAVAPGEFAAAVQVADCRAAAGKAKEAEAISRELLARAPERGPADEARASASLARALSARGKRAESSAQWSKVLAAQPETRHALALYERLLAQGRREDAMRFADQAAAGDFNASLPLLTEPRPVPAPGDSDSATRILRGTESELRAKLAAAPRDFDLLCAMTQFLRERNRLEESLASANVLVTVTAGIAPKNRAEKWLQRAETLMQLRRFDEAAADAKRALLAKPGDFASLWLTTQILSRAGRPKDALPYAERLAAAASGPREKVRALVQRSQVRRSLGDARGADADEEAALRADPRDDAALEARVQSLRLAGRLADAEAAAGRMVAAAERVAPARRAALYEQRAQVRRERGDLKGAEADLRSALAGQPDALSATQRLSAVLLEAGKADEALEAANRFLTLSVQTLPALRAEALELRARALEAQGRASAAAIDRAEAALLTPNTPTRAKESAEAVLLAAVRGGILQARLAAILGGSLWNRLLAYFARAGRPAAAAVKGDVSGRFQASLRAAETALAAGRRNEAASIIAALEVPGGESPSARTEMFLARGKAKAALGDFAGAEADLRAGLALKPRDFDTLSTLAQFLRERGKLAESLEAASALVVLPEVEPRNRAERWLQRAETLMRMGRGAEAEADVKRALADKPEDVPSLWLMAQVLLRGGRARDAVPFADRMVAAAKTPAERAHAYSQRAQVRDAAGDAKGAEADRRRALAAEPGDHVALEARVQRLRSAGRLDEALAAADRMVAAGKDAPPTRRAVLLDQRAEVKRLKGDAAGAEADLREALKILSDSLPPMRGLAELLLSSGRPREALPLLDAALASDAEPTSRAASLMLRARVRLALGLAAAAAADLRAAAAADAAQASSAGAVAAAGATDAPVFRDALGLAEILVEGASEGSGAQEAWRRYDGWLGSLREKGRDADALSAVDAALRGRLSRAPAAILAKALTARAALRADARDERGFAADFEAALRADAAAACRRPPLLADPARLPAAYFAACLRRFPGDAVLLADQGVALWRVGRRPEALASLRAALKADPGSLPAALSLDSAVDGAPEGRAAVETALARSREPRDSPLRRTAHEVLSRPVKR